MFLFRLPPIAPDPAVGDVMSGGDITWLQLLKNKLKHLNLINGSGITAVQKKITLRSTDLLSTAKKYSTEIVLL